MWPVQLLVALALILTRALVAHAAPGPAPAPAVIVSAGDQVGGAATDDPFDADGGDAADDGMLLPSAPHAPAVAAERSQRPQAPALLRSQCVPQSLFRPPRPLLG